MSFKQAATDLVHEALEEHMDFLVLRGVDDFARDDGDIDVLVPIGCSRQALLRVTERAFDAGWTIPEVRDIGYLTQICLVQRRGEERPFARSRSTFSTAWLGPPQSTTRWDVPCLKDCMRRSQKLKLSA